MRSFIVSFKLSNFHGVFGASAWQLLVYSTGPLVRMYQVCHKKLRLNLLGPIRNWAHSLHIHFILCLNFLWHTPHAVALDKVLSLSPKQ